MLEDGMITLKFDESFDVRAVKKLLVISYPLNDGDFKTEEITINEENPIIESDSTGTFFINNVFSTNKVFPLVFGRDDFSYILTNVDLTPSRVIFKKSDFAGEGESLPAIKSVLLYSYESDTKYYTLRKGVDDNGVTWEDDSVIVDHMLDGYVNAVIDYNISSPMEYDIYYVSKDKIKIQFKFPENEESDSIVCSLRIFKIGQ